MRITIEIDGKGLRPYAVGAIILGALGLPIWAYASSVTIPHTFVNGQIADANDANANFSALASAVNDNDARIGNLATLRSATMSSLVAAINESFATQAIPGTTLSTTNQVINMMVTMPASPGFVDLRPPQGEVWTGFTFASESGFGMISSLTDGASEFPLSPPQYITNGIWLRARQSDTSAAHMLYFSAIKKNLSANDVGGVTSLTANGILDFRPPSDEIWWLYQIAATGSAGYTSAITDGTHSISWGGGPGLVIDHNHWLRLTNGTTPQNIVILALRAQ